MLEKDCQGGKGDEAFALNYFNNKKV